MREPPMLPAKRVRGDQHWRTERLTVTELLKYSPIVTRAVAVMEVSMVASNRPKARLNEE